MGIKIIHATGQMCNQFWIYSNFISNCIEINKTVYIWVAEFDLESFDNLYNSKYFKFPLYNKRLIKLFGRNKYNNLIKKIFGNKLSINTLKQLSKFIHGIQFTIADVNISKNPNRLKYLNTILDIFSPNNELLAHCEDTFKLYRSDNTIIVGVHIRHGDYETFNNGKFYYQLTEYYGLMKEFKTTLKSSKKVVFFIASNGNLDLSSFEYIDYFYLNNSNSVMDMIGLSKCDYIFGPPSSFSAWASLMNHVPLYFIEDISIKISSDLFFYIEDQWM